MAQHIEGNRNHDAVDDGDPIKIGGVAKEFDGTDPGSVAENDRVDARFDRQGNQFVNIANPYFFHTLASFASATTGGTVISAPGANLSLYITDIVVTANTAASFTFMENNTTTGNKVQIRCPANDTRKMSWKQPIKCSANVTFALTTDVTVTAAAISGYIAP